MKIETTAYKIDPMKELEAIANEEYNFFIKGINANNVHVNNIEADYTEVNEALRYDNNDTESDDMTINVIRFVKDYAAIERKRQEKEALKEEVHSRIFAEGLTFPNEDFDPDNEEEVAIHEAETLYETFKELLSGVSERLKANSPKLKTIKGFEAFKTQLREHGFEWWIEENKSVGILYEGLMSKRTKARWGDPFACE